MLKRGSILGAAALVVAVAGMWESAGAAVITPGNIVVYRVGDGQAALGAAAAAVFLDEYSPAGALVQTIPVAATGASALTATGNSATEGIISISQDGNKLVFAGYRADAGTSTGLTASTKVIGSVGLSGIVNTSIGVTDAGSNATRSATTTDGSIYYLATAGAVRYVGTPGAASTSVVVDARNSRQVSLAGNILYGSNGSSAITTKVQSYGTLPTGATTPTAVSTQTTADAVNGIFFADVNPLVAGVDTLYVNSTFEGKLRKYSFDGTTWADAGSIASTAVNLTGVVNGTNVTLYLTTGPALQALTDTSGIGGMLTGTPSPLATAGTNTAFRGVGVFTPVPEPTGLVGLVCGGLALGLRRRK